MKFSNCLFQTSGALSIPHSQIKVMGRWMVQMTCQLFALSFPHDSVPQSEGTSVTQDRSSVRAMSSQTASMMSLPRMAPELREESFRFFTESSLNSGAILGKDIMEAVWEDMALTEN